MDGAGRWDKYSPTAQQQWIRTLMRSGNNYYSYYYYSYYEHHNHLVATMLHPIVIIGILITMDDIHTVRC